MLQNRILQVLSLIAMEAPCRMDAKIRREKTVLSATRLGGHDSWTNMQVTVIEEGVNPNSNTPTYVAGSLFVDNWRWEGVPFRV